MFLVFHMPNLGLVTDLPVVNRLKPLLKVEKFEKFVAYVPCLRCVQGENRNILKVEKFEKSVAYSPRTPDLPVVNRIKTFNMFLFSPCTHLVHLTYLS